LGGRPYSYDGHEFQEAILSDTSQEVNVRKCSQVGVSEASARLALALTNVVRPFTAIYTLPTAHFAKTFTKTRIDPIIKGSKVLSSAIDANNDTTEVKQFGDNFLYVKGAASSNAPISIPSDSIIQDEQDFCDQEVLSQYTSRLTHSPWKLIRRFSTPTVPGYGVDLAFQSSRRHYNLCKCSHCNHWFNPDYYKHVKIPGYTKTLEEITKQSLASIAWKDAALHCPACGKVPSLLPEHRQYVCENSDEALVGAGYQVSPFDAPTFIVVPDLIRSSTNYVRRQDFVNFGLGLPMEDKESALMPEDFDELFVHLLQPGSATHVMGIDVGHIYHFVVGACYPNGDVLIVHRERVPMNEARKRYADLRLKYRVVCSVIDSGPHAETVMALQDLDPNLYASVYMRARGMLTHNVVDRAANPSDAVEFVRQVNVNRNRALDAYMEFIRQKHLLIMAASDEDDQVFQAHHTSMKRIRMFDHDSGEMTYSWQKSDGVDHFHHAGLYCWLAGKIRGVGRPLIMLPTFTARKFRIKE
jgi:hypothetical protein